MEDHTPDVGSHSATYSALTLSFLAGGIAGATVALLLAPQSGKVTRELMGRKLNDAADSARMLRGRMADQVNVAAESVRTLKDRAIRRGQEIREEATSRVEGAASALAGRAEPKEHGNGDLEADDSSA
jgi:gas vesicle protein